MIRTLSSIPFIFLYLKPFFVFPSKFEIDRYTGPIQPVGPILAGFMTGFTYKFQAGPRVAGLAGVIGLGAVGMTYTAYSVMGIPFGAKGWLFF